MNLDAMNPSWELSKENIIPLKKGRKVNEDVFVKDNELKRIQQSYEDILKTASDPEVILQAYVEYYTSIRRATNNSSLGKSILEKATQQLNAFAELKNDVRLTKLWIEYVKKSIVFFLFLILIGIILL